MTANITIIGDALELLNVNPEGSTPTAEQGAYCLRRMNQMLEAWEEEEVKLGFFAQSDTSATCPIPAYAEKGVTGMLAIDVASHYGATVSAEAAKVADDGYQVILRKATQPTSVNLSHLSYGGSRFDIDAGE